MSKEELFPNLARAMKDNFPESFAKDYERLLTKIDRLWGSPEAPHYLTELIFPERSGRQGFPYDAMIELTAIKQAHDEEFPDLAIDMGDPFALFAHEIAKAERNRNSAPQKKHFISNRSENSDTPLNRSNTGVNEPNEEIDRQETDNVEEAQKPHKKAPAWQEIKTFRDLTDIVAQRRSKTDSPRDQRRFGEILVQANVIQAEKLDVALSLQKTEDGEHEHEPVGKILLKLGSVTEEEVLRAMCVQSGIMMADIIGFDQDERILKRVPISEVKTKRIFPLGEIGGTMFVAVEDPFNLSVKNDLAFSVGARVELVFATKNAMSKRLVDYGKKRTHSEEEFRELAKQVSTGLPTKRNHGQETAKYTEDSTIIGMINKMLLDASTQNISDIHVEIFPTEKKTRIRFRKDGRLEPYAELSSDLHDAVVSRIKIMSDLNIAERRQPQDGKIRWVDDRGNELDMRISVIPTLRGYEDVTIRLLQAGEPLPMSKIGMSSRDLSEFGRLLERPYGLVLVCGPTGSGKTTTLHSALRELNTPDKKIWTAEDPIEIVQKDICQVQINSKIGWTFAAALRAFLRSDPDVVMIGEMRDHETAKIAVEASMTGHLVLSTLHTNSASETAARLLDLGIDQYNLSDALLGILAQRLARKLCGCCTTSKMTQSDALELSGECIFSETGAQPSLIEREELVKKWRSEFGDDNGELFTRTATGCKECQGNGYKGRIGLYEMMPISKNIAGLIRNRASAAEIRDSALSEGMRTLKHDGIRKVLQGLTDIRQVRSACA